MSSTQQIASFRKVSAGILASAHLASQEDRPKVTKKEISLVLKRVAPALGIDGTAYHVLDILLGLVQPDDFQAGKRPVVAISNQRLAEYTRRTTRTVTRCLKKLVEAGVLAYRDSPTGRRYVYRGSEGALEQAYGLDFSPACFNLEAFKVQADAFQRRIKAEQEARRAVTRFSRAIADMAELEPAEFHGFAARAQAIVIRDELNVVEKAALLESLYAQVLALHEAHSLKNKDKMSCAGDIDVSPLFITTPTDSLESNPQRTCSNEQDIEFTSDNGFAVEMALEKEPCGGRTETQQPKSQVGRGGAGKFPETNLDGVSIGLIQSACSSVQAELGVGLSSWPALCGAAEQLRMLIGLSPSGYQLAVERQGRYLAAACLAVVAEKALRDPEHIASPGGYFRAMIDRAGEGKLHLHKSLHGLV
ncbi:replication protein C (plasmid) [Labrenzia sp. 5N]|jgi:replication initiation protein RepC|uniref:plasmid replication protein RepC n=1 Tax=Stappiaceae TaxID=2821832 RepID=UPI00094B07A7|nr:MULTISPECIES: plasmid replication protein RepC [Stappiaceae]MBO9463280.1 plasmid replication protein RepCa2 [Labrenzia sp. R5_0]NKX68260.1 replication protein C [Labrenzia sp. 5N]UES53836.1 replication protein C [Roseibium aggregatum]UFI06824.1 replication protein C [Roseibium aggregatum]